MGSDVHQTDQSKLIQTVMEKLTAQNQTIAFATDFLTNFATDLIDREASFAGLFVAPTDDAKNAMFDIPYQILNANGSQSEETTIWMARQAKAVLCTDYAIAVTRNSVQHTIWIAIVDQAGHERSCSIPFYRTQNVEDKVFNKAFELVQQSFEK